MWAYEGAVPESGRSGEWTQPDPSCWLLRKGSVEVRAAGKTVKAKAGQWVFVATPTRWQRFSGDAEILSVHFHFSWPGGEPVIEQPRTAVFDAAEQPALEKAALALARIVKRDFPRAAAFLPTQPCTLSAYLRVQNMLPRWLSAYLDAQARLGVFPRRLGEIDDRVLRALAELDRKPLSEKFSERALLRAVGAGRSQLNALFYQATGLTPRRYHERRRRETALRLLAETGMSLKEIALDLGFGSESHFSHWFRGREKIAPSAYRASRRPKPSE
jgi:AraC-type DNA-binding domain-containing proteins